METVFIRLHFHSSVFPSRGLHLQNSNHLKVSAQLSSRLRLPAQTAPPTHLTFAAWTDLRTQLKACYLKAQSAPGGTIKKGSFIILPILLQRYFFQPPIQPLNSLNSAVASLMHCNRPVSNMKMTDDRWHKNREISRWHIDITYNYAMMYNVWLGSQD